jgi:uncharacterized protein YjbJ (UPF0337 family)
MRCAFFLVKHETRAFRSNLLPIRKARSHGKVRCSIIALIKKLLPAQAMNADRGKEDISLSQSESHPQCAPRYVCNNMTKLTLKGTWNEIQGKLKQKYATLTDDDLVFVEGKEDELLGRLQQRLGRTKEDLRREIEEA